MCHLKTGSIHDHYSKHHHTVPTRQDLVKGTTVLDKETDGHRLILLEALYIAENKPTMNCQARDLKVLPTMKRSTSPCNFSFLVYLLFYHFLTYGNIYIYVSHSPLLQRSDYHLNI